MPPLPDDPDERRPSEEAIPPAAPGQGRRPPGGSAEEGVPSPTMPTDRVSPAERPENETPPRQESQPPPTLTRWVLGVGALVIVFAIIWTLFQT